MNNIQILKPMQKQHLEIKNNLEKLEELKWKCQTEIGTESDKKNYNKILNNTEKLLRTVNISFNMLVKQKIQFPPEFVEIGIEIDNFNEEIKEYKIFK